MKVSTPQRLLLRPEVGTALSSLPPAEAVALQRNISESYGALSAADRASLRAVVPAAPEPQRRRQPWGDEGGRAGAGDEAAPVVRPVARRLTEVVDAEFADAIRRRRAAAAERAAALRADMLVSGPAGGGSGFRSAANVPRSLRDEQAATPKASGRASASAPTSPSESEPGSVPALPEDKEPMRDLAAWFSSSTLLERCRDIEELEREPLRSWTCEQVALWLASFVDGGFEGRDCLALRGHALSGEVMSGIGESYLHGVVRAIGTQRLLVKRRDELVLRQSALRPQLITLAPRQVEQREAPSSAYDNGDHGGVVFSSHATFRVVLRLQCREVTVERRYREFRALRNDLVRRHGRSVKALPFPPKKLNKNTIAVTAVRATQLKDWLLRCFRMRETRDDQRLLEFCLLK